MRSAGFATSGVEIYDVSTPDTVIRITNAEVYPVASSYSVSFANTIPAP